MGSKKRPSADERARRIAEAKRAQEAAKRKRNMIVSLVIVAVFVLVGAGIGIAVGVHNSNKHKDKLNQALTSQSAPAATSSGAAYFTGAAPSGYDTTSMSYPDGKASAPVRVDLFEDFQCAYCHQTEQALGATFDKLVDEGKIQVNYHTLNFLDGESGTYSTRAAQVVLCAANSSGGDTYRKVHDELYKNYPGEGSAAEAVSTDTMIANAEAVGVSGAEFESCARSSSYKPLLESAVDFASKVISRDLKSDRWGTPTLYINGVIVDSSTNSDVYTNPTALTEAIDAAAKSGTGQVGVAPPTPSSGSASPSAAASS